MHLDLPTMMVALLVADGVTAAAMLVVSASRKALLPGLAVWGWGLVAHALSVAAFALRLQGMLALSIILSNVFTALTLALHTWALVQCQRDRVRRAQPAAAWVFAPVLLIALVCVLFMDRDAWRVPLTSAVLAAQGLLMAWQAWAPGLQGPREQGRWLLLASVTLLVLTLLGRLAALMGNPHWDPQLAVPAPIQAQSYLMSMLVVLLNTMGYLLMRSERAVQLLHEQATHDALTGVANRQALMEVLQRTASLAARQRLPLALLMVDVDHFKRINDTHGHLAGDAVLRELTRRIASRLRRQDLLARFGGEEFMVLLPGTDAQGARVLAEAVRQAIADTSFVIGGQPLAVTASVGVHARVPEGGADAELEQMLAASDQALYQAKQGGRNRVALG